MKRLILTLSALLIATVAFAATTLPNLPKKLHTDGWKAGHVQGIAVDAKQEYIYLSFTTMLVKLDMKGNVIGTVTGILGHLGCLEFNEENGRLYGSLEYKNDAIGKGILRQEGVKKEFKTGFYVAIFDVDKITRENMSADKDGIMKSVLLKTVVEDFETEVVDKSGATLKHRYGCSGFDGISFGPAFDGSGKRLLTVAYGIYGDKNRTDNDHQVLLQYDISDWAKYEAIHSQDELHRQGPDAPYGKYFVYTGNTTWGVQNLEYDKSTNLWFLACYTGKKEQFANYSLFCVDGAKKAKMKPLRGVDYQKKGALLTLSKLGVKDPNNGKIYGWRNKYGACGTCALGDGYFYITKPTKSKQGRGATLLLTRFVGGEDQAFEMVK